MRRVAHRPEKQVGKTNLAIFAALTTGLALGALAAGAQEIPKAEAVVKPAAYVSLAPVPQGAAFEVAVVAEILPGFHINSNKPLEDYLIATTLKPELPPGLRLVETAFPKAKLQKFDFSENALAVFDGSVTVRLKLQAAGDAPLGAVKIPMTLRYQACNDRACLRPVNKPVVAEITVAAAGTKPQVQHPGIFGKR